MYRGWQFEWTRVTAAAANGYELVGHSSPNSSCVHCLRALGNTAQSEVFFWHVTCDAHFGYLVFVPHPAPRAWQFCL